MRQRLLFAKCLPSDRKLKTGAPRALVGGKLKVIGTSSIPSPAARITGPVSLISDVVGLGEIEFALMARNREVQSLHHLAVLGPTDVLLVVVAHVSECRSTEVRRKPLQTFLSVQKIKNFEWPFCHGARRFCHVVVRLLPAYDGAKTIDRRARWRNIYLSASRPALGSSELQSCFGRRRSISNSVTSSPTIALTGFLPYHPTRRCRFFELTTPSRCSSRVRLLNIWTRPSFRVFIRAIRLSGL